MTIKCCVQTCTNIYKSKGRKIGDENNNETLMFHRFPRNEGQKTRWINSIRNINGSTWEPKDPLFVCSVERSAESEESAVHSHTMTQDDTLLDWLKEVKKDISNQTTKEQNTDLKITSLTEENEQLKKRLTELDKILNKILGQNEVLRNSNKNMSKQLDTWKNIKKREEGILTTFNKDQREALRRKNSQGVKWESATLKQALILKLKCGSSGYEEVRKLFPLPSLRTLQRRTEYIEFRPGILNKVFELLANEIHNHREEWKDCVLALDEMSIIPGEVIDPSINESIGRVTFGCHEGFANKALVFVLGGIAFRWKQCICYHFTSSKTKSAENDATGKTYVEIIKNILECAETIGLRVHCVISDMGSDNRSMWKIFGIMANRDKVIHEDVIQCENLPSNTVKVEHILELLDTEAPLELKVAFRLKKENLDKKNRFNGMKVSTAKSVFCQRTSSCLQLLALSKEDPSYITTAWFVRVVNHWFDLMTSRHHSLALNKSNEKAYEEAISHLKLTIKIFSEMRVGIDSRWKPVQCGVLIATNAILSLQHYFLNERGYKYLLTGRFTQDFLENIFSCIRFRQAVPNALTFKHLLKTISIAQFCTANATSSYDQDDDNSNHVNMKNIQCKDPKLNFSIDIPIVADECIAYFATWERIILYDMAGSAVHSVKNVYSVCDICYNALLRQEEEPHPYELLTELNAYGDHCLTKVSEETFKAIWKAELTFRLVRENLMKTKNVNVYDVLVNSLQYVWASSAVPQCHDITTKVLRRYFTIRYKQFGQMRKEELKEQGNVFSIPDLSVVLVVLLFANSNTWMSVQIITSFYANLV
ncbi:hypothetical protein DBV15_10459 [Temnothorax longispinosus]|uniref:THAP-type domain-containing protein n=1 Tax=Temnothorax longispinosus TaxID=300112 RepID=A0A4S2L2E1_9HYME|nr:hypothetical protein DBV15_10459 [Temnothorax longispinosus]